MNGAALQPIGGDHNVYFLGDDPPIYRSPLMYHPQNYQMDHDGPKVDHVTKLFELLRENFEPGTVFCIPHWGGRRGNPQWHDPQVQRLIEIFSEHRRSEDWAGTFLTAGHRLGIMASGDNHSGNPGYGCLKPSHNWDTQEIGMALIAVQAEQLTRESIFRALYDRRVYATSGARILLDFRVAGQPMGSEVRTDDAPRDRCRRCRYRADQADRDQTRLPHRRACTDPTANRRRSLVGSRLRRR